MQKIKAFVVAAVLTALLSGCTNLFPERTEIDDLLIIDVIGLDKDAENPDKICMTVLSKKKAETPGGESGAAQSSKNIILSSNAATSIQAARNFQTSLDKKVFWGHVEYYLIGEAAAREGINKYIDLLTRDHEMRGNSKIHIVEGTSAKEFIEKSGTGEYYLLDRLDAIGKNAELITGASEVELVEFMLWLNSEYMCAVLPTIKLKPREGGKKEGTEPPMDIDLGGYAVFKDLKLVSILDRRMTRGKNFLLNKVKSGIIEVKDPDGNVVGLEIIEGGASIKPVFEKDELKEVKVSAELTSNIDEVHSTSLFFEKDVLKHLSEEQSKIIKGEIEGAIAYAKENNTDFVDIANVIETKHPIKWLKYKDRWDEVFPNLQVNVEVVSKINRTYDIREPSGVYEEEHK